MALAGDAVFVAGAPAFFPPDNPVEAYEAAYEVRPQVTTDRLAV
jgi:hypothetical protein